MDSWHDAHACFETIYDDKSKWALCGGCERDMIMHASYVNIHIRRDASHQKCNRLICDTCCTMSQCPACDKEWTTPTGNQLIRVPRKLRARMNEQHVRCRLCSAELASVNALAHMKYECTKNTNLCCHAVIHGCTWQGSAAERYRHEHGDNYNNIMPCHMFNPAYTNAALHAIAHSSGVSFYHPLVSSLLQHYGLQHLQVCHLKRLYRMKIGIQVTDTQPAFTVTSFNYTTDEVQYYIGNTLHITTFRDCFNVLIAVTSPKLTPTLPLQQQQQSLHLWPLRLLRMQQVSDTDDKRAPLSRIGVLLAATSESIVLLHTSDVSVTYKLCQYQPIAVTDESGTEFITTHPLLREAALECDTVVSPKISYYTSDESSEM